MQYIIPNGEYTLNPSAQTIALTDTSITLEKILSVRNITLNMDIYNSQRTGTHKLVQESTPGLFSYTYSGTMVNTDVLQICVEIDSILVDDSTPVDINVTNIMSIPVAVDPLSPIVIDDSTPVDVTFSNTSIAIDDSTPVDVEITNALPIPVLVDATVPVDINVTNITSIPVAVDPLSPIVIDDSTPVDVAITNTSIAIDDSTPVDVAITNATAIAVSEALIPDTAIVIYNAQSIAADSDDSSGCQATALYKKAWFFITHTASTNLTVEIRACSSDVGDDPVTLQTFTLNTTVLTAGCCITDLPPYIRIYVDNNDVTNATALTVKMFPTR